MWNNKTENSDEEEQSQERCQSVNKEAKHGENEVTCLEQHGKTQKDELI